MLVLAVLALAVGVVGAQQEENLPNALITTEAGGVQVRYLNFKWNPEGFEALEKGAVPRQAPGAGPWVAS